MISKALPAIGLGFAALLALPPREMQAAGPAAAVTARASGVEASTGGRSGTERALARALTILQADGEAWMEGQAPFQDGQGCVSCHQVPYGVWGLAAGVRAGLSVDHEAFDDLSARALDFVAQPRTGRPMSWSPLLLGLGNEGSLPAEFVDYILGAQRSAGFWEARGQFPTQRRDLGETNAVATLLTILALSSAVEEDAAVRGSVESGYKWVAEHGEGESTEWRLLRALVEQWRGNTAGTAERFAALLSQQNGDGGWAWLHGEESNGYSTGQVLWGLAENEGAPPEGLEAAASRAAEYLFSAQDDDGWWRVPSTLTSNDADEGKDYVYAYWGTAWATIGLASWQQAGRSGSDAGKALSAESLLARSIRYHDPEGLWTTAPWRLTLTESRPDGGSRATTLELDSPADRFAWRREENDVVLDGVLAGGECELKLDGSTEFSNEERERHRLTCGRLELWRDYYGYLWGLPMKLTDPGTRIAPEVDEARFAGRPALVIQATYDAEVGDDVWYFYFDPDTAALVGYRFYHDEDSNDGEYILLAGELEADGLRLPKERTWYTNAADEQLGIDTLIELERLTAHPSR